MPSGSKKAEDVGSKGLKPVVIRWLERYSPEDWHFFFLSISAQKQNSNFGITSTPFWAINASPI